MDIAPALFADGVEIHASKQKRRRHFRVLIGVLGVGVAIALRNYRASEQAAH